MKTIQELQEQLNQFQIDLDGMKPKSIQLQPNKWYRGIDKKNLIACYVGNGSGYGFGACGWTDCSFKFCPSDTHMCDWVIEATESEVRDDLIKEAERRGFKHGVKFKCACGSWHPNSESEYHNNCLIVDHEGLITAFGRYVMYRGKWAEIIKEEPVCLNINLTKHMAENTIKKLVNGANNLKLIQETDINGTLWYWIDYNGERVPGSYTNIKRDAEIKFEAFTPIIPKKEVIDSRNV